jgi:hypothetical protein
MDCSGGRADGNAVAVQRLMLHALCGFFVALYALGMVPFAYAGGGGGEYIPRGQPIPQGIRYVNATAGGVNTSASAMWTDAAGRTTHHKFPVHVSAATLGRLANAAVRRGLPLVGWGLTLKGIVDAAGWVIDELEGQVSTPGIPLESLADNIWCITDHLAQRRCANTPGQLSAVAHLVAPAAFSQPCSVASGQTPQGGSYYRCIRIEDNFSIVATNDNPYAKPPGGWTSQYHNHNQYEPPAPIPAAEIGNLIRNNAEVVNAVLIDPQTGAPVRTQELTDALNNLRRGLEAANGLPAGDDLDPATDYADPTPSEMDFPEFCHWADVVCDFIEWVKKDEPDPDRPDLPIDELDPTELEQSWSSGMGSGSCPAPYTFEVYGDSVAFEYQPICDIVDLLRPFMIAIATVVGACIVAGVRVGKNA